MRSGSRSSYRYNLLSRNRAISRLRRTARGGNRTARRTVHNIRSRAWRNLRALVAGLKARALLRRAVRRRIARRPTSGRRSVYGGYIGANPIGTGQRRRRR